MAASADSQRIIDIERGVLRALCQGTPEGSVRDAARLALGAYRWREPAHQVIFQALMRIASDRAEFIREHLPGRVTLRGFPEVDWEDFFRPHSLSRRDAEELIRQLAGAR